MTTPHPRWTPETFAGATMAAFPGLPASTPLDEAERLVRNVLRYLADAGLLTPPGTWALPAEPGPEVTAVRDRIGQVWQRDTAGWSLPGAPFGGWRVHWRAVLDNGPLTDATEEADRG